MRIDLRILAAVFLLAGCKTPEERKHELAEYQLSVNSMSCAELTQELVYQNRIKEGLIARQKKEVVVDDFPATVFLAGANVAMNHSNKLERNERLEDSEQKIMMLEIRKKGRCTYHITTMCDSSTRA